MLKAFKAFRVLKERKAPRGREAPKVFLAGKERKDRKVLRVHREKEAPTGPRAPRAIKDPKARKGLKVFPGRRDPPDLLVYLDFARYRPTER